MGDAANKLLTGKIAALGALADSLSKTDGPHYAALAQLSGLAEEIVDLSATGDPLAAAIADSLFRVLSYPLHDHPKFNELIAVHAAALDRAVRDGIDAGSPRGIALMRTIGIAVDRIVPADLSGHPRV